MEPAIHKLIKDSSTQNHSLQTLVDLAKSEQLDSNTEYKEVAQFELYGDAYIVAEKHQ